MPPSVKRVVTLISGAVADVATEVPFNLEPNDFENASLPAIKTRGLGTGDSVVIHEKVDGDWQAAATLDENTTSQVIRSIGDYAVTAVVASGGPVSVDLNSAEI
jgi:hypothetical protein